MSTSDANPYESHGLPENASSSSQAKRPTSFRWRLLPSVLSWLIGGASLLIGVFAVTVMLYVLFVQNHWEKLGEMIAGCVLYLGTGISWVMAGVMYWNRRYLMGLVLTLTGVLIPATLFAIFGFGT